MTAHDTVAATAPYALHAVARHMLDHDLQVDELRAPLTFRGETSVIIQVSGENDAYWSARWEDTIAVDSKIVEPSPSGLYDRLVVHGRLPDSGVRVSVVAVRILTAPQPAGLSLVPGGAA